jgi:hypothetical protein
VSPLPAERLTFLVYAALGASLVLSVAVAVLLAVRRGTRRRHGSGRDRAEFHFRRPVA